MKVPKVGATVTMAVQTTEVDDWGRANLSVVGQDGTFSVTLPARGVLTLQFATSGATTTPPGRSRRRGTNQKSRRWKQGVEQEYR